MRRSISAVTLGLALAVAGCSSVRTTSTAGVPTTGADVPSTMPAPTPKATEPYTIVPGPLEPGRYVQSTLTPHVSFALAKGWYAYFNDAEGAYLGNSPAGLEFVITRPALLIDPKTNTAVMSPPDLAGWLAKSPAFATATTTSTALDGRTAVLVEAAATKHEQDLLAGAAGNFHTVTAARYAFYVVPMDGPDLLLVFMAPSPRFDAALPTITAMVESVRIGRE